jgi:hypothetical protein
LTLSPLARDLRLKAERALATARELQDHDPDGSVLENDGHNPQDKISEPDVAKRHSETDYVRLKPVSIEEMQRQARENWLQLRRRTAGAAKGISDSKDAGRDAKEDQNHSTDDDLGE